MKRRDILTAAAALPVLAAAPAVAVAAETPVMKAYREWRAYSSWINGPATRGMEEDAFSELTSQLTDRADRVIAATSQSDHDVVIKFLTAIEDYQMFFGIKALEALEAEARSLVGGAA